MSFYSFMKIILLNLILLAACGTIYAQQPSNKKEIINCSTNVWALDLTPVSFLGLSNAPVKIVGIGWSGFNHDKTPINLELENLSGRTIKSLKVKWFIYRVDQIKGVVMSPKKPKFILQGESPSIKTDDFKANERKNIDYRVGSCHEIYEAYAKDGETEGDPWMEAAVIEILYADGSKWTR